MICWLLDCRLPEFLEAKLVHYNELLVLMFYHPHAWVFYLPIMLWHRCHKVLVAFLSWKIFEQGNTAVYLLYAHARICSIIRKSGKDIEELKKVSSLSSWSSSYHRNSCCTFIQPQKSGFFFWLDCISNITWSQLFMSYDLIPIQI